MTKIKYIGVHQPQDIIDIDEKKAKKLVESKQYEYVEDGNKYRSEGSTGSKPIPKKNKSSKTPATE